MRGETQPLTDPIRDAFNDAYARMGGMGERVLGLSLRFLDRSQYPAGFVFNADPLNIPMDEMVFGMCVLMCVGGSCVYSACGCVGVGG